VSVFSAGGSGEGSDSVDCAIRLWDSRTRKVRQIFAGHRAPISALAVSSDGEQFLSAAGGYAAGKGGPVPIDCAVRLWDVAKAKQVLTFSEDQSPVIGAAFLPGGNRAISCDSAGTAYLWKFGEKPESKPLPGDAFPATCLAVSGNGRYAVAGGADGTLHLWDLGTGKAIERFERGSSPVHAVAFSGDHRLIAVASGTVDYVKDQIVPSDCVVRLRDLTSGKVVQILEGHTRPVRAVAFGRKGKVVVSGALDGTVRLWSVRDGEQLTRFSTNGSGVTSVVLLEGKGEVAAGCVGGSVEVWDLPDNFK
jgi:WD40 repeat protein